VTAAKAEIKIEISTAVRIMMFSADDRRFGKAINTGHDEDKRAMKFSRSTGKNRGRQILLAYLVKLTTPVAAGRDGRNRGMTQKTFCSSETLVAIEALRIA
jgi:hypothetical protein